MSKNNGKNWDDPALAWDPLTGEFDREETAFRREDLRNLDGVGLPDNPAPGPKWQATVGIMRLGLNGTEIAVLWCLIDHASKRAGYCWPSQQRVAHIIGMPLRTVRKAIASLRDIGLIEIIERFDNRGKASNAYVIQWKPIFAAYKAIEQAKAGKGPKWDARLGPKWDATPCPKQDATHRPKWDRPPHDRRTGRSRARKTLPPRPVG